MQSPLTPEEIAALPLPPINRYSWRAGRHIAGISAGMADDFIDHEMHSVAEIVRLPLPGLRGRLDVLGRFTEKYVFTHWRGEWYNVTSSALVRELYAMSEDDIDHEASKDYGFRFLLGANSPFLLKGREHAKVRKALIPHLSAVQVEAHRQMSVRVLDRMIDRLPVGHRIELRSLFREFAQEMIIRFTFGLDDDRQPEIDGIRDCLNRVMEYSYRSNWPVLTNPLVVSPFAPPHAKADAPPRLYRRARALWREADAILYNKFDELAARPNGSVASHLVALSNEEPAFWTRKRVRDMFATLLVAGHDTSVNAYSWTAEFLLHDPAAMGKLVDEARRGQDDCYSRACTSEAIRMKPPLWGQFFMTRRDIALAGYRIRRGTFLFAPGRAIHANADLYPEPLRFLPERFLQSTPDRFGYITFGAGRHRCPGTIFVGTEASLLLQRLFGRCDIVPLSDKVDRTHMDFGIFNRPAGNTDVIIRHRRAADEVPCFDPGVATHGRLDILVDEMLESAHAPTGSCASGSSLGRCPFPGAA